MFTGIIRATGKVIDRQDGANVKFVISIPDDFKVSAGDSISCNGVCLTVAKILGGAFEANVMDETLKKSNLDGLQIGGDVNLEPAAKLGESLDGHIVQGHVDTIGNVLKIQKNPNGTVVIISFPAQNKNLIVEKGSICVDGISLTAFDVGEDKFSVSLVDFTLQNTTAGNWQEGQKVNLEFDIIGKYVAKIISK
ncbi:riboflavin synthase [Candidatus Saccharibacteria bacterium]|nr:riboflavin synthase [Candidatus Saccharibacteria bacterium]